MNWRRTLTALVLLPIVACKEGEVAPAECPDMTMMVAGVCRLTCASDDDCLFSEACVGQACVPRNPSEGPKIRLFQPDRLAVTSENPQVRFDYVVTNASRVELMPTPGVLNDRAGTVEVTLTETTEFTLVARAMGDGLGDSRSETIVLSAPPPPGELGITFAVSRSANAPCDEIEVQWTIVGDDLGGLQAWIEADGTQIFQTQEPNSSATLPIDAPHVLKMFAQTPNASGNSSDQTARPSLLCWASSSHSMVSFGDTILLEWETQNADAVRVEDEITGEPIVDLPVFDRTKRSIGRWILAPPHPESSYRIVAHDQAGLEDELSFAVDVVGEPPAPIIDWFYATPPWFEQQATLDIEWLTRLGGDNSLSFGNSSTQLPGASGSTQFPIDDTAELIFRSDRNQRVSIARRMVWFTLSEAEPNDAADLANSLRESGQQSTERPVARRGNLITGIAGDDVDWYSIDVDQGMLRLRVFDPTNRACADLGGVQLSIHRDAGNVVSSIVFDGGSCPYVVLDQLAAGRYFVELARPINSVLIDLQYVLAADTAPLVCGDSTQESSEGCDDGNGYDLDGCASSCVLEPGYAYAVEALVGPGSPPQSPGEPLSFTPLAIGDDASDRGFAIVPADINFFGHHYAGIIVHVDGYVTLLPEFDVEAGLGSPLAPNAFIAAFASDLRLDNGALVAFGIEATPEGTTYAIDYVGMTVKAGGMVSFRITIQQDGDVRFEYDPSNLYPADPWIGGIEDASGRYSYALPGCGAACYGPPISTTIDFTAR